jgi:hypothetical protein
MPGSARTARLMKPAARFPSRTCSRQACCSICAGSGRDVAATLWSNVLSTPIEPFQNRSFREGYGSAAVSVHHGIHDFKFGADVLARSITERFSYQILAYQINGAPIFDPDNPPSFFFEDRRQDREQAAYVQDQIRSLTSSPITLVNPRYGNGKARAA